MQMVQSLTELGKILLVKEIFSMLTSILRRRNTFFFERLTPHHSTPTPFLTNHIQSSNIYLKWSTSTVTSIVTALFTMELLKGSSEHGKTTIQNLLDTVNAWMWLSYQKLKDHGLDNNLSREIHKKALPYQCCDLCLSENFSIICTDPGSLLNKRTELISKCRHRNKFLLASVKI